MKKDLSIRHYVVAFTTDELSRFLIKEGVYELFINNCVNYIKPVKGESNYDKFMNTIERSSQICHISSAFVWQDTPEGCNFWGNLNARAQF